MQARCIGLFYFAKSLVMQTIDETYLDLVALINAALHPHKAPSDIQAALMTWLTYEARRIPRRPRTVIISDQVKAQKAAYPAIEQIIAAFQIGGDLLPWLHDAIRTRKADHDVDLMFNDWQVNHLHLGNVLVKPDKMRRTGDLLFVYVTPDRAVLLDVQPHGSWVECGLLRTLLRISPQDMEGFRLKNASGLRESLTHAQRLTLRKNRYNAFVELDGAVFMAPGMGTMSDGHPLRIVRFVQQLWKEIANCRNNIITGELPFPMPCTLAQNPMMPVKFGIRMEAGELILYDKNRDFDFIRMRCVA
jgi:hypothetical protein